MFGHPWRHLQTRAAMVLSLPKSNHPNCRLRGVATEVTCSRHGHVDEHSVDPGERAYGAIRGGILPCKVRLCYFQRSKPSQSDFGHRYDANPTLAKPTLAKPTLAKPTLAKPTLANVKVLVVCKDLGFSELIVWVF